jgi:hypothetical protein
MKRDKWLLGVVGAFVVALLCNLIELKNITGIPAHPLLLHAPVIFIPSLALATLVLEFKPDWRKQYGIALGFGAAVTAGATALAANAGETWEESLDFHDRIQIHDHAELGDKLKALTIRFGALIVLQLLLERGALGSLSERFQNPHAGLSVALAVVITIVAVGAALLTLATGHEGAKAVFGHGDGGRGNLRGGPPPPAGKFTGKYYGN